MAKKLKKIQDTAVIDATNGTNGFQAFYGRAGQLQSRKDVLQNSTFQRNTRLPQEVCENVYMDTWIGKNVVKLPVSRAMRNGLKLELESNNQADEKRFWKRWDELKFTELAMSAQASADIYGSSIILLKDRTQNPLEKVQEYKRLEPEYVEFPFFTVMPKPTNVYAPGIVNLSLLGIAVDESFCAPFIGVPVVHRLAPSYKYFGMSVYQSIWSALINDQVIMTACANITYRSSIRHYKLKGLQQQVLAGRADQALARTSLLDESIGIFGSAVMDSEDEMQVLTQTLTGLADIDRRSAERLAAATGIPATILLGKSPDGQNSTGENDEKNMIAFLLDYQKKMLTPLNRMAAAVISELGIKGEWKFTFNSPAVIEIGSKPDHDKKIIENAQQLQTMGLPEDVTRRYMLENGIITQDEHDKIDLSVSDYDKDEIDNETDATQS